VVPHRDADTVAWVRQFRKVDGHRSTECKYQFMASLYIHIPFCEHKCIYCDFYSIAPNEAASRSELPTKHFVEALTKELRLRAQEKRFQVSYETVFLGGGTPSLLSIRELDVILKSVRDSFSLESDTEVTIETNPGTVTRQKLEEFRSLGLNRISFGVQSFHEDDLRFLTRIHSSGEAKQCVRDAFAAGFDNVSLDLMFSIPGQTKDRWQSNLNQAMELDPTHISCYSLIVEPNTPLSKMVETKQISLLGAEEDASLYEMTIAYLAERGYEQYEVSNFAKPGFRSRHNRNYWNHSNYIGFGPSAHSFWTTEGAGEAPVRWWNVSSIVGYFEKLGQGILPVSGSEQLSNEQLLEEEIFLGLRSEGIDIAGFNRRFGKDLFAGEFSRLNDLLVSDMAVVENGRLRLTPKGYMVCDEICASLRV
jgi:oxygen-independent coproporphyrinogen III oxidase